MTLGTGAERRRRGTGAGCPCCGAAEGVRVWRGGGAGCPLTPEPGGGRPSRCDPLPPVPRSPERATAAAARLPSAVRPRRALRCRGMLWDAVTWCLISSGRLPPPRSCREAGTGSGSEADSFGSAPSSSPPPFFMSSCQLGRAVQFGSLGVGSELGGRWEVGGRGAPLEAKSWS